MLSAHAPRTGMRGNKWFVSERWCGKCREQGSSTGFEFFEANLRKPCYGEAEGERDEDMAQKWSYACLWVWQEQGLRTLVAGMGGLRGCVGSFTCFITVVEREAQGVLCNGRFKVVIRSEEVSALRALSRGLFGELRKSETFFCRKEESWLATFLVRVARRWRSLKVSRKLWTPIVWKAHTRLWKVSKQFETQYRMFLAPHTDRACEKEKDLQTELKVRKDVEKWLDIEDDRFFCSSTHRHDREDSSLIVVEIAVVLYSLYSYCKGPESSSLTLTRFSTLESWKAPYKHSTPKCWRKTLWQVRSRLPPIPVRRDCHIVVQYPVELLRSGCIVSVNAAINSEDCNFFRSFSVETLTLVSDIG